MVSVLMNCSGLIHDKRPVQRPNVKTVQTMNCQFSIRTFKKKKSVKVDHYI